MWPSLCSDANASPAAIPGQAKTGRLHSLVMQRGARKREASGKAVVGVIADTHGLLRPEAVAALASVDLIVHAGDIGRAASASRSRSRGSRSAPRARRPRSWSSRSVVAPRGVLGSRVGAALTAPAWAAQYRPHEKGHLESSLDP